jgi:hypothetical protein
MKSKVRVVLLAVTLASGWVAFLLPPGYDILLLCFGGTLLMACAYGLDLRHNDQALNHSTSPPADLRGEKQP